MIKRSTLALVLIVAVTAPSFAQEISGSGESVIINMPPRETELPNGRIFRELQNQQILIASDLSHPFHHVALTCSGTCMVNPGDETGSCVGGCNGRDQDGDVITFSWDGMDQGGWKLIGGSGKWSKARGSGTWKDTGPMGAGFTRNTWTGSIRMK